MCCWSCRDSDENVCFSSTQCRCPVERRARLGLIGVEIGDCEFAARHDRIRTTTYLFRDAAPANFGRGFLFYMVGSATSGDEEGTTSRRSINGTAWPSSSASYRRAATIFKSCTRPRPSSGRSFASWPSGFGQRLTSWTTRTAAHAPGRRARRGARASSTPPEPPTTTVLRRSRWSAGHSPRSHRAATRSAAPA